MATKFGLDQRNNPTPKVVSVILKSIKRICKVATGASIINSDPYLAVTFLCLDGVADEILPFFGVETDFKDRT